MKYTVRNGIPVYRFELLDQFPELDHGVFSRAGGVSTAPYDQLNTALQVGDDPRCVMENRRMIGRLFDGSVLVFAQQVHGSRVARISGPPPGNGEAPPVADAMISDHRGLALTIQVADCQSVMLYDPVQKAIANIHCGWRGSTANIIGETVARMVRTFGSRPSDLVAGIGPSLGPCCAEFVNYRQEIPEPFWPYKDQRDHFDFWAISHDQLTGSGLRDACIEHSRLCTRCRSDVFFSYRQARQTGRFATVITRVPPIAGRQEAEAP